MSEVGICRSEKVRSAAALRGRHAHNVRSRPVANADAGRRSQNVNLRPDLSADVIAEFDAVHARLGKPKLRKNGVFAIEYVMTFSPSAAARIDATEWAKKCIRFVEERHGQTNILSAFLHLDEKTPHVHVLAVPAFAGAIVVGPFMGNKAALRTLQDNFHREVSSRFGLARTSQNPTGRVHIPPAKLRSDSATNDATLRDAFMRLDNAVTTPRIEIAQESVSIPSLLTATGRRSLVDQVAQEANRHLHAAISAIQEQAKTIIGQWHEQHRDWAIVQEEYRAMKASQTARLRDIDLHLVAEQILGFAGKREGSSFVWESDAHKLVVTGAQFKDFKQAQRGLGGGAIDLVMHLLDCDYAQAIRVLAGYHPALLQGAVGTHHARLARKDVDEALTHPRRLGFAELLQRYAAPVVEKLEIVRRYLSDRRCISLATIDRVIANGDLWANRWGSCVFAHRNISGDIVGCSVRATSSDFKQALGDKTNSWFFLGARLSTAEQIVVTESPIDALSYAELHPLTVGTAVLSTGGASEPTPLVQLEKPFILAHDHDDTGEEMARRFSDAAGLSGSAATRLLPPRGCKDWNEALTKIVHEQRTTIELTRAANSTAAGITPASPLSDIFPVSHNGRGNFPKGTH